MRSIRKKNLAPDLLEDDIHIPILLYLDWVLPKGATPAWHTPNGGKRDKRTGAKLKRLGTRAGFPDIAFLYKGKFYAFEVKTKTGTQRDTQVDWEKFITEAGGFYAIVRNTDEVKKHLQDWDIIPCRIRS